MHAEVLRTPALLFCFAFATSCARSSEAPAPRQVDAEPPVPATATAKSPTPESAVPSAPTRSAADDPARDLRTVSTPAVPVKQSGANRGAAEVAGVAAPASAGTDERKASVPAKYGKVTAPAVTQLSVSGTTGTIQATLDIQLSADVPRGVARFVIPNGVELTNGDREKDFGALRTGETRQLHVTLVVPSTGTFVLAGGIDLYLSAGVKLHSGDAVRVGAVK